MNGCEQAVEADDVLLGMLGCGTHQPGTASGVDGELARVLSAWRREVHAVPDRLPVDAGTVLAVVNTSRKLGAPGSRGDHDRGRIGAVTVMRSAQDPGFIQGDSAHG